MENTFIKFINEGKNKGNKGNEFVHHSLVKYIKV